MLKNRDLKRKFVDAMDRLNNHERWMIPAAIICVAYFVGLTIYSVLA